jgi:protein tyrosine phosphatase type 4A
MSINIIPLTFIEYKTKSFYISESPSNKNIGQFISSLKQHNIKHVIRLCKPIYDYRLIENEQINFYDIEIPDGAIPCEQIIDRWNKIIENISSNEPILVHCIAGLGRGPLMVTISLINEKMDSIDAINLIRKLRPGSINSKQLGFLINYKSNKIKQINFFRVFKFFICK